MTLVKSEDEGSRSGVVPTVSPRSPSSTAPASVLAGKYRLGPIVGVGSFGIVYEAENLELGEKVAIKCLRPEALLDGDVVRRFAREAKAAASIKSEYVATVFDVGTISAGEPYIVMEHLEGTDLGALVEQNGPMPAQTVVEYALQICEALALAHSKGIVHRDIKPENLLLTERAGMAVVKVLDFGISKAHLTGSVFGEAVPTVETTDLIGTPLYMSPEQVRRSGTVDVRSDIWSLGMVLYELLAGRPAFEGRAVTEICAAILEGTPQPLERHRRDLPRGLAQVVARCLEKDVMLRYQNVAELALALMPFAPMRSRLNVERAVSVLLGTDERDSRMSLPPASSPWIEDDEDDYPLPILAPWQKPRVRAMVVIFGVLGSLFALAQLME
jgi:serine/threonine protein kinase